MDQLSGFMLGALLATVIFLGLLRSRRRSNTSLRPLAAPGVNGREAQPPPPADTPVDAPSAARIPAIYKSIAPLAELYQTAAHPSELENHPALDATVALLLDGAYDDDALLNFALGEHLGLRCAGFCAVAARGAAFNPTDRLIAVAPFQTSWFLHFALRAVAACARPDRRVVCEMLVTICVDIGGRGWASQPAAVECLRDFIIVRHRDGEDLRFTHHQRMLLERHDARADVLRLLERLGEDVTEDLRNSLAEVRAAESGDGQPNRTTQEQGAEVQEVLGGAAAAAGLSSLGRVWDKVPTAPGRLLLDIPEQSERVSRLERSLDAAQPRSCLLVGEPGVGKRATVEALAQRLLARKWHILEAGHTDIIANQKYVGMFEGRLQEYVTRLNSPRRLWYIPDFGALRNTGVHDHNQTGALQLLLPNIERGELRVVGTLTPSAYESLVQGFPWARSVFDIIRVEPLDGTRSLALARRWIAADASDVVKPRLPKPQTDRVLEEAWLLAEQFLSDRGAPGNLLQLLSQTRRRLAHIGGPSTFSRADLVATLAELTGLPPALLDDRQNFDVQAARNFFGGRVLGQEEAVECLVQRITMMKAGLTDPTRPQGVFLFAGPTGTGKTEIAKVLAEYLFGSPERLIRVDMSEYNVPGSAMRLLRTSASRAEGSRSLVSRLRQQPFSVVLLDEFEKSARDVWDLFLQVADDGRLTDDNGDTVDCRHTIIILTSNLGAVVPTQTGLGFVRGAENFRPQDVEKAIGATFRQEFLNRLDRVVVFRPFTRETMRELLQLEIRKAARRRGLRHRDWATIWDDSAVDFLLARGFTADLGARPLRRAVERYLLEPLASIMAEGRTPAGDQFLFVHADGDRLVTEFIDPDAPSPAEGHDVREARAESAEDVTPQRILLDPRGGVRELAALRACFSRLSEHVNATPWRDSKQAGLDAMTRPDFWDSDQRFAVLGRVENIDRVESGLESAGVLLEKLTELPRAGDEATPPRGAPRDLVWKLANTLYLLEAAVAALDDGAAWEAYVLVDSGADTGQRAVESEAWAQRLAAMYEQWAQRRRMKREILVETGGHGNQPWRQISAISGYAAYSLLADESGLHVWEEPETQRGGGFSRRQVLVRVVPQPPKPATSAASAAREAALLLATSTPDRLRIVRYYRASPSPLVRDRVRGWRCGRLERVLEGAFDVMSGS